jgi:YHS domain-containing protein
MVSQSNRAFGRLFTAALACAAALLPAAVRAEDAGAYSCPVLHNPIPTLTRDTQSSDYMGVRYYFCCEGCKPQFDKDQAKFLKDDKNKNKTLGASLFDPITAKRLDPEKAAVHSDYNGVRYFFAKEDDKTTFDKDPKKYAAVPKKEVLFCPVSNEIVESYEKAADYSDIKGVRYYFCCPGCKPQFDKNPDKYLHDLDEHTKAAEQKKAAEKSNKDSKQ